MTFSHVLLTRPLSQSLELAAMLEPLGLRGVVQPAFSYLPVDARAEQADDFSALGEAGPADLVLFTSPRAVRHGLPQIPAGVLSRARVGAIGPATAQALVDSGVRASVQPAKGFTSEDLLETLASELAPPGGSRAFIMAAPGGRTALAEGLGEQGRDVRTLMVYRSEAAALDRDALGGLEEAQGVLSVWTSGNTMKALSQRLPPNVWFRVCQGEWLVISGRLERLARAYGPAKIHRAAGPGNNALLTAIRNLG